MARKKNPAYTEEFRRKAVKRSEKAGVTQAMLRRSWVLVLSKSQTGSVNSPAFLISSLTP